MVLGGKEYRPGQDLGDITVSVRDIVTEKMSSVWIWKDKS